RNGGIIVETGFHLKNAANLSNKVGPPLFSCWNKDDPNARLLQSVTEKDLQFATALRIARRAVYRAMIDVTNGADHYHAIGVIPLWSKGERPVAVIGNHIFYKLTKGKNNV
ncbi:MAG: hypothetical protein CO093_01280, partial [Alphaproteobacteria bacterium CG_4_9_14_3_um_filter_47_13]